MRFCIALLGVLTIAPTSYAELQMRLFDAHLHYNANAAQSYAPDVAIRLLDGADIRRGILSSTPNEGTSVLLQHDPGRFVPFLRPYHRTRDAASWSAERSTWYKDPSTLAFLKQRLANARFKGIGEFHVDGDEVDTPVMRELVNLAVAHDLWLMAHSDASAIEQLFAFNSKAKIIWAHTGMTEPEAVVAKLLEKHPALMGELSYRSNVADHTGVTREWRELFLRYPDRFLYGSDTWVPSRWPEIGSLTAAARRWLADLPRNVAEKIAFANGERLFGR
jgi:hypothetical protein